MADEQKRWIRSLANLGWPLLLGFAVFFILTTATFSLRRSRAEARQPIEFNHRLHVEEAGISCSDCHEFYDSEAFSGMPTAETCALCHEEVVGESPNEARLVRLLESGAPLEWRPLFRQPAHVFYSHRRHVGVAGLECEVCHGSIGASERPPRKVDSLLMQDCLDCHLEGDAATDCTACHR